MRLQGTLFVVVFLVMGSPTISVGAQVCRLNGGDIDADQDAKQTAVEAWATAREKAAKAHDPKSLWKADEYIRGDLTEYMAEHHASASECTEGYWTVTFTFDKARCRYDVESAQPFAETCCSGFPCSDRTPAGWMVELSRRSGKKDRGQLLALIDPRKGFTVIDEDGRRRTYRRDQGAKTVEALEFVWDPGAYMNLACPASFSDGEAVCRTGRSGSYVDYRWAQATRHGPAYLLSKTHLDTGE